jgi:hypothetical protein
MFKRLRKLEEENEILKNVIKEKDNCLAAIITQTNKGHAENLAVAFKYYARIKELAEIGLDIKNEQVDDV